MVTGAGLFAARRAAARPAVRQAKIEAKFGFLKKSYGADVADLVKAILNHVPAAKQNVIANMCVASIKKSLRERSTSTVATDFLIRLLAVRLLFRTVSPDVTKPLSVGEFKRVVSKLHKKAPTTLGRADWNDCGLEFYPSGQK